MSALPANVVGGIEADLGLLRDITQGMLEAARAGEWDVLASLEQRRLPLLRHCCETAHTDGYHTHLIAVLGTVLHADQEIIILTESAQGACAKDLRALDRGQQARDAYRKTI
jgi:hypothetical protein